MKKVLVLMVLLVGMVTAAQAQLGAPAVQAKPVALNSDIFKAVFENVHPMMMFAGHSVALTWTQGTCTNCTITGNIVYRAGTTGGPYTAIFTSTTPITAYTDNSVAASTTYFYTVTATCSACTTTESAKSNEFKAIIPADPTQAAPPSGLTGVVQ